MFTFVGRSLDEAVGDTIMGEMGSSYATEFFARCVDRRGYKTMKEIMVPFFFIFNVYFFVLPSLLNLMGRLITAIHTFDVLV